MEPPTLFVIESVIKGKTMKHKTFLTLIILPILILALGLMFANTLRQAQAQESQSNTAIAINTAFTYQGRLTDSGDAADGVYDFQFKLHDVETGGGQVGSPAASNDIAVAGGLFTVQLDFGRHSPVAGDCGTPRKQQWRNLCRQRHARPT